MARSPAPHYPQTLGPGSLAPNIGDHGPSDSALAAAPRLATAPPSRRPARGALRFSGPVLGRAPLGAMRPRRNKKPRKSAPQFDLRGQLYRISGVDLTRIEGITALTAQTVVSEVGLDMSAWPTEKHFASWLGLCPDHRISGGKILKRRTRPVSNRAATALRLAASTLRHSQSALGANFRRLRARLEAPKAITALAHKLARLVYRMLKYGRPYVDRRVAVAV